MDHASIDHTGLTGAGGSVATDALFDAKGDLAAGTGSNTASKLTVGANNKVLTAASAQSTGLSWLFPPGYEYDYTQKTSDTSITATSEATANTVLTAAAVAYDGSTPIFIEFGCPGVQIQNASAGSLLMWLYDDTGGGAASIGLMGVFANPGTLSSTIAGARVPCVVKVRLTPSSATHTYSVRCYVTSGTGTIKAGAFGASTNAPAYVRQTKV